MSDQEYDSLTDDYVATFVTPEDYCGMWARMLVLCGPPGGVDTQDARVIDITNKCREALAKKGQSS